MNADLQKRVQRYGWDRAAEFYENSWQEQLKPAHDLLLQASGVQEGENILDLAAGTGLISFRMAEQAGSSGNILATDISDEMVSIGNALTNLKKYSNVRFERMDAEELKCGSNSFDLVTCALGLMYLPNPDISANEMLRVLKPGGRAVVAVWGSRKKCGWAEIFPIVDSRVKSDVCPMFFSLGESVALKYLFENAGFHNIKLEKIETKLCYVSDEEACQASFEGGPVAMAYARFDEANRMAARKEYIASIQAYKNGNGYEIPGEFVVCSGQKNG
jgi:ubiquinone/menaquinone biosynthesis C-methylase UbiE